MNIEDVRETIEGGIQMTLRQLIQSVRPNDFQGNVLFRQLKEIKPEYGANIRIKVRKNGGTISVTNVHVGSLGDIVASPIEVANGLHLTDMSNEGFTDADTEVFWDDMTVLQKARIVR